MTIYAYCKKMTIGVIMAITLLASPALLLAQTTPGEIDGRINAVFTAIPFLRINPDARTGGMGDVGIAISTDPSAMYHNASKLAFADKEGSASLTYTPWLRQLVPDIYIAYLSGYKKIGDLQALGLSLRYFSLGELNFTTITGDPAGQYRPNELAVDLAYSRKLSDKFSAGITLKYVRSDLASGQEVGSGNIVSPANAAAADVSFYYQSELNLFNSSTLSIGGAVTNIGNKVSYTQDDTKDFIPINLGIGTALKANFDDYNSLTFAFDINKLLVPTPDLDDPDAAYRDKSLLSGIFGSFGDAPGGAGEELKELMYSVGLEYWYNDQFAVRAGHYNEHSTKGNRKFVTVGVGLKYSVFGLNFSYLVPTTSQQGNPLDNTLRFSLMFDFAGDDTNN